MTKIRLSLDKFSGDIKKCLDYFSEADVLSVFPNDFVREYTRHETFVDFLQSVGCDMTSQDDLDRLQSGDFDNLIPSQSDFDSWQEMVETAYQRLVDQM